MPFKSEKQKEFLRRRKPKFYKEFAAKEKAMGGHKAYMKKEHEEDMIRGYKRKPY